METATTVGGTATSSAHRKLAWGFMVIAWIVLAAGHLFDLYRRVVWFDEAVHAYATFALTLMLSLYMYGVVLTGARRNGPLLIMVIASVGLALGALWEVGEWGFDQLVPGDVIKGKQDTIIDLIMDTGGALVAGLVVAAMVRRARVPGPGAEPGELRRA